MRIKPGQPYPLGATWDGTGVNFAIFSEGASRVELCLFDAVNSRKESVRITLDEYTDHVWHIFLPNLKPGQLYGYRIYGPYDPIRGNRFNPHKILLDPYAKAIGRTMEWDRTMFAYDVASEEQDLKYDERNNAPYAPLAAVIDPTYLWGDDAPLRTPWRKTIIYEAHVKGMTMLHPLIDPALRGTYGGLASAPVINHLRDLGVTAIELMPIHYHIDESHVHQRGQLNYWGYNTAAYFAPDPRFACSANALEQLNEFKRMVQEFHRAGIEVILDVVYNHTAEGNHLGPTFSFRGIDNNSYYRLRANEPRHYLDFTGCGNTLNMQHPRVIQLMMDSLRYWVEEMHVDGFRFDLASALARELYEVDRLSSFFDVIHQDPVISQVKLIAEPWDLGEGGYQVGNFPVLWTEWNGKYRDNVRSFWRGDDHVLGEFATRISGSSDLYRPNSKSPNASINFVTCHDGFTLLDLVSYNHKHNEQNLEENQDGTNDNRSWNCGVEGLTTNTEILKLRQKQRRNLITTLFFSLGVPMILGGDELSRTQFGNNNAYCQDNEQFWLHWELDNDQKKFLEFVKRLVALRKASPVLQRRKYFSGELRTEAGLKDIVWLSAAGDEMSSRDWHEGTRRVLGVRLHGDALAELDEDGCALVGDTLLLLFNGESSGVKFVLPAENGVSSWELILNTAEEELRGLFKAGDGYSLESRSISIFRLISSLNVP